MHNAKKVTRINEVSLQKLRTRLITIAASKLRPHPTAQRAISPTRIRALCAKFDLDKLGTLQAVECEIGGIHAIWIVDGQHRWRCLMDLGLGDWEVDVSIHLDYGDEAKASALFLGLNDLLHVQPRDRYEQLRLAGDPVAVAIAGILTTHELKVVNRGGDGCICCIGTLLMVCRRSGANALNNALDTVISAWGRTAAAVEGKIVDGLSLVYERYGEVIDKPSLIKKLAKYRGGPSGLIGDARSVHNRKRHAQARCVAEQVLEEYNSGRSTNKLGPL